MQVNELMTRDAVCTHPDATLQEAALRMKTLDVGSLPVCDNDHLVGVLTDRDIAIRSVSEGHDPRKDRVRDAMTPEVVYCFEDNDISEAARLMGVRSVLCGLTPEVVMTLQAMDIELTEIETVGTIEEALEGAGIRHTTRASRDYDLDEFFGDKR